VGFVEVSHISIPRSRRGPVSSIFGTSYVRAHMYMRNDNQILHGYQTRCEKIFLQGPSRMLTLDLFAVYKTFLFLLLSILYFILVITIRVFLMFYVFIGRRWRQTLLILLLVDALCFTSLCSHLIPSISNSHTRHQSSLL